jgi:hypothetical protein
MELLIFIVSKIKQTFGYFFLFQGFKFLYPLITLPYYPVFYQGFLPLSSIITIYIYKKGNKGINI